MRPVRSTLSVLLVVAGTALAVAAALGVSADAGVRVVMALCGILLVEAAAWQRSNPILPCERKNHVLREEVEAMVRLVRLLDSSARAAPDSGSPGREADLNRLSTLLHEAADRVIRTTGREAPTEPTAV